MSVLTKLAATAGLACAIAVAAPAVADAAPATPAAPAINGVGCTQPDFFKLSNGSNAICYANWGSTSPNYWTSVASSGNNCGFINFTYGDGTKGTWSFDKNQTHIFPHNGQDQIVYVTVLSIGCIG